LLKPLQVCCFIAYFVFQSTFYFFHPNHKIMTWQTELQHLVYSKSFRKRIAQGAGIALVLVCVLLLILSRGNIGPLMLVPMAFVSLGGALGGAFYSLMDLLRIQGGGQKIVANVLSMLVYVVLLYGSLIYALSLTGHWD
jgi:uncharacterized membrane protein YdfJ with MMPL/SSD domain